MKQILALTLIVASLGLSACSEPVPRNRGVFMLIDTSGTYTRELSKAQQIINAVLTKLNPGDSFAVARIDTGSFSEKDIVAKVTFDERPSVANQQKRAFLARINRFVKKVKPARYTDITGGILQASEYLSEKNAGSKTILVFSDLKEELKKGYIRNFDIVLDKVEIVALNVTKLRSDNVDPREYMARLKSWETRVQKGGGVWRVINDLDRLERIING
jgi:hypothetical protein